MLNQVMASSSLDSDTGAELSAVQRDTLSCMDRIKSEYVLLHQSPTHFLLGTYSAENDLLFDELSSVRYKFLEVVILRNNQERLYRKSNRHLLALKADNHSGLNKLIRPGHFSRDSLLSLEAIPNKRCTVLTINSPEHTSAWDGSEYKRSLANSLVQKLSIKFVFKSIAYNRYKNIKRRKILESYQTFRSNQLLRLCFLTIYFEAKSSRFIELRALGISRRHRLTKIALPTLQRLRNLSCSRFNYNRVQSLTESGYNHVCVRRQRLGLNQLKLFRNIQQRLRLFRSWSINQSATTIQMKAILVWKAMFITRNALKVSLGNRLQGLRIKASFKHVSFALESQTFAAHPSEWDLKIILQQLYQVIMTSMRQARNLNLVRSKRFLQSKEDFQGDVPIGDRLPVCSLALDNLFRKAFKFKSIFPALTNFNTFPPNNNSTTTQMQEQFDSDEEISLLNIEQSSSNSYYDNEGISRTPMKRNSRSVLLTLDIDDTFGSSIFDVTLNSPGSSYSSDTEGRHPLDTITSSNSRQHASSILITNSSPTNILDISNNNSSSSSSSRGRGNDVTVSLIEQLLGLTSSPRRRSTGPNLKVADFSSQASLDEISNKKSQSTSMEIKNISFRDSGTDPMTIKQTNRPSLMKAIDVGMFHETALHDFIESSKQLDLFVTCFHAWKSEVWRSNCSRHLSLKVHRNTCSNFFRIWKQQLEKVTRRDRLVNALNQLILQRRVFRSWTRGHRRRHTYTTAILRVRHRYFTQWIAWQMLWIVYRQRMFRRQKLLHDYINPFIKQLKSDVILRRRHLLLKSWRFHRSIVRCLSIWRHKLNRRLLLKRVFTVRQRAIIHRNALHPLMQSEYQTLTLLFQGWRDIVAQEIHDRTAHQYSYVALVFRGKSLLIRHFLQWLSFHDSCKAHKLQERKKVVLLHRAAFLSWACWLQELSARRREILATSMHRYTAKVFHAMINSIKSTRASCIRQASKWRLKRTIKCLKLLVLHKLVKYDLRVKYDVTRLRYAFHSVWRWKYLGRMKIQQGLALLDRSYWLTKQREVLSNWPGRAQWQLAEKIRLSRCNNGTTKINIVDIEANTAEVNHEDDNDDTASEIDLLSDAGDTERRRSIKKKSKQVRSFIEKTPPTLSELAFRWGYVRDPCADKDALTYVRQLVEAILLSWHSITKNTVRLRLLTRRMRVLHDRSVMERSLYHWMEISKSTSHRILTWMKNRNRYKPHTQYITSKAIKELEKDKKARYEKFTRFKKLDILVKPK